MSDLPKLDFVMFYVSDLDAAFEYFTQKLNFVSVPEEDTPVFRYLRGGEGSIDFALRQAQPDTAQPGTVQVYFKTNNLETLRDTLTGRGVKATEIMHPPFGSIFHVDAPDRHKVTMWSNQQ